MYVCVSCVLCVCVSAILILRLSSHFSCLLHLYYNYSNLLPLGRKCKKKSHRIQGISLALLHSICIQASRKVKTEGNLESRKKWYSRGVCWNQKRFRSIISHYIRKSFQKTLEFLFIMDELATNTRCPIHNTYIEDWLGYGCYSVLIQQVINNMLAPFGLPSRPLNTCWEYVPLVEGRSDCSENR